MDRIVIILLIVVSTGMFRMAPLKTDVDVYFLISMILWALVEAGNDEKDYPGLITLTRRVGITIAAGYLFWISIYYIN